MSAPTVVKPEGDADQPEAESNAASAKQESASPPIAAPQPNEAAKAEEVRQQRERHRRRRKRRLRWRKAGIIAEFLLGVGVLIATGFNAWFVRGQWNAMTDTLKATNDLVVQAQKQNDSTKQSADAAADSAKAAMTSNQLAEQTMKLTHRAWLYFGDIPPAPDLRTGTATWKIQYWNYGRGPATHIWAKPIWALTAIRPPKLTWSMANHPEDSFERPLPPNQTATETVTINVSKGSKDAALYMAGKGFLTVQMLLEYADEFGDEHVSSICLSYQRYGTGRKYSVWSTGLCPDGNYQK